jgi:hypothetical protein
MEGPSLSEAATAAPLSASDKAAAFEEFLDPEEEQEAEPEGAEDDLDLAEEEADEPEVEPETAIDAPVSLNAEEKKAFAAASPEAQQAWAASETRRNAQVQEATTKASEAQRMAEARAAQADAEAKAVFAQQLDVFVAEFAPRAPDIRQYNDQLAYLTDKAQYDDAKAQHDELVQHVRGIQTEANTEAEQAFFAQRDRELLTIPEVANPETRQGYLDRVMEAAEALGYDRDTLARSANAFDITAIAQAAEWKAKADRFDKAMAKQMQKVRAQKGKSLRPGAAAQNTSAARGAQDWQRVKGAKSKEAQAEAFADYMGL